MVQTCQTAQPQKNPCNVGGIVRGSGGWLGLGWAGWARIRLPGANLPMFSQALPIQLPQQCIIIQVISKLILLLIILNSTAGCSQQAA